jgi:hypothetical protein
MAGSEKLCKYPLIYILPMSVVSAERQYLCSTHFAFIDPTTTNGRLDAISADLSSSPYPAESHQGYPLALVICKFSLTMFEGIVETPEDTLRQNYKCLRARLFIIRSNKECSELGEGQH